MKTVTLPSGERVPVLGQGTWFMGGRADERAEEIAALRRGIELGMTLIDTAEMYGDGQAEALVGDAVADLRKSVFIVSKVLPKHASRSGTIAACERSLRLLKTDWIDLYLLHWRGDVPFAETIAGFEELHRAGKIRYWGVSNLDLADMRELIVESGGDRAAVNQVLYNLTRRGIEWDLLPWCMQRGLPVMAYSPVEQARLLRNRRLIELASQLGLKTAQLALAWVLRREGVIAIPKAANPMHVEENARATEIDLSAETVAELDKIFPPPDGAGPLDML